MQIFLGLGSNLGNRFTNIQETVNRLGITRLIRIVAASPVYETVPVGGPDQPDYYNAVIEAETSLSAHELLRICLSVEGHMGRTRQERWGPRTIDIDILMYGAELIRSDNLIVPHPRMHDRAFVLKPLADIAPDIVHPGDGKTIKELLNNLDITGVIQTDSPALNFTRQV